MSKAAVRAIRFFEAVSGTGIRGKFTAKFFSGLLKLIHPRSEVMNSNMLIAYPDSSEQWRKDMIRKCYEHLGWTIAEILALQKDPLQVLDWVKVFHNDGLMRELLAQKKGVLFLSGHIGNWEILSSWYAQYAKQHGHELHIVYQELHDLDVWEYVREIRERSGQVLLPKNMSVQKYAHMLKEGMHLALLDDIAGTGHMMVPFMGKDATNMPGPAIMALLSGVPVIPVCSYRTAPFQHEVFFLDPVKIPDKKENHEDRVKLTVQAINEALETLIRKRPEQWFWLHKRWRP
mgnify:FL=1